MNAPGNAPLGTPAAELKNLRVEIDGRVLVDGVDLRVLPGRVTALVGASGSGKTTTGLALLGEHPPGARVSGEVRVSGGGPVGYVPQHPATVLNPARRVGALLDDIAREQVRGLPRSARRTQARSRVLRALEDAQLPEGAALLRRYPHQLSGGQQQRVVLAQALLLGAKVVVADEPTTGQDALTKRRIVDELTAVVAQGIALVLLSHDLDVVRALADDVLVMREGQVVESGPTERVWLAPRHEWTRELVSQRPQFAGREVGREGDGERSREGSGGSGGAGPESGPTGVSVLQVRDLTARHHRTQVLRVPELVLRTGECLAVVGRSGSGKTTLARCLAGLHRDYDGQVTLDGSTLPRSLRDRDRGQLATVQYVFQDARAAFDEYRPVVDQVARTAVRLRGVEAPAAEAEALTVLAELGLTEEQARRRPGRLSGGELQRAALARALLARPRVLICDEITSGLDTVTRRGILDVLAGLRRERDDLSVVLVTHDLDTAALADRIAVLDAGEMVEQGPVARVFTAPSHAFTRRLLAAAE
ncbi:ABC transporter ATP-binding protein [Streptomyces turgidiscabies]|uniref:ABC transporter, ATP-binding protein n=1 Tax=Streptomyces turgidiscabies (strain Car8) TaxID=698760 RepID=L7F598_STRT8|nr:MULTISPECIES: ATP-binding cassette domain-containing protein [Streptomyces]ELP66758.1 ABC transporter, ATP-binding protein [Streptomyces turgidiscabies Car8]MDX3495273.1 ATP-binding cassette domain-containing protein [Streptomyces turgidiscabies]GAQ71150.1 glutathione import ATP-binding protein GsiA [Streptomyces turgidiscabies]